MIVVDCIIYILVIEWNSSIETQKEEEEDDGALCVVVLRNMFLWRNATANDKIEGKKTESKTKQNKSLMENKRGGESKNKNNWNTKKATLIKI